MREILFRGKRIKSGQWIFGNLLRTDYGVFVIQNYAPFEGLEKYEVGSETVCQFTGLIDNNDKKIFEGDIISFSHSRLAEEKDERDLIPDYEEYTRNYVVEFVNTYCTYGLRARNKSIHFKLSQATINTHNAKVIGNIYDNPELLKEDTQNANPAN